MYGRWEGERGKQAGSGAAWLKGEAGTEVIIFNLSTHCGEGTRTHICIYVYIISHIQLMLYEHKNIDNLEVRGPDHVPERRCKADDLKMFQMS